jgi:hypothetical protein
MPTPEEAQADLDAIFDEREENGIPRYLLTRHVDIIARHGLGADGALDESLVKKCFPGAAWARGE